MRTFLVHHARRLQRSLLARLALASPRLAHWMKTPTPLPARRHPNGKRSRRLIVFLPGIDDLAEDFERRGFIHELRRHGVGADAVAIDAHFGYYASRSIHDRISEDVIADARRAGYTEIWLAGISLGGFGAVSYAARHGRDIDGVLLFAPYLGGNALIGEIAQAGGIRHWQPGEIGEDDYPRAVWKWIKDHAGHGRQSFPIYLGYGARDMFARGHALLAEVLPRERVLRIPGGHDWRTWRAIWRRFLSSEHQPWR